MDIYSGILTSHGFLHTNYKSLLMPYITKVHPRATAGVSLVVLSVTPICGPAQRQRYLYNGSKRIHAIKFMRQMML